ncbi:translation initiation factor IF-2 [Chloroflexi bacterium TSY]|nr:translation initiation factor IF-2 [Chloroflexi bacterium TSY]
MATQSKQNLQTTQSHNGFQDSNGHNTSNGVNAGQVATGTSPSEIVVDDFITVRELAELMNRSPIDLIKVLMQFGIMAPITRSIDHDTAVIIGEELNVAVNWPEEEEVEEEESVEEDAQVRKTFVQQILSKEKEDNLISRSPVVAVLGHVDHGKTTLLDQIRNTNVVAQEAGGITQRTGAYQVTAEGQMITFLDTPGHEAFTGMRARGAQVTDIVVLVVAADDGIMPQTKEAISHAQAAGVQIIVALNKIDRPNANRERVMEELSQHGLQPEEWGGDTIVVPVSALYGDGVDDLLENILLVAELEEYKANPKGVCVGTIIEAELDKYRGVTATILVQNGTLRAGDTIVVGKTWGRTKAMFDYEGKKLKQAGPSTPAVILGLQDVPMAGESFARVRSDKDARRIAEERQQEAMAVQRQPGQTPVSLDDHFARFEQSDTKVLNLIVRADMQGTLEPVTQSLEDLEHEEIKVKILQAAIGNVSESDVMLAEASDAIIIGFSVGVDKAASVRAEASGIEIRLYNIIYKMIEEIELAITGMLDPIYEDVTIGHAEVLQLFKLRRGVIAGCNVTDGVVKRNGKARILRNGNEIHPPSNISTLRRFTEDVNEVRSGYECGIRIAEGDHLLREGDVLEITERQRVR